VETFKTQLEWIRMGSYFLQDSNQPTTAGGDRGIAKYSGHDLLNLRVSYDLCASCTVFARVLNLADARFAESASVTSNTAVYAPGLPRAFFAGLEVKF
jgi:outer membrane receptor protein involved in Fe transport